MHVPTTLPLAAALLSLLAINPLSAQVEYRTARLGGDQEVPPVTSSADGWGVVRVDTATNQVRVMLRTDGASAATAAHLHNGATGNNGPVLLALSQTSPEVWTGTATLSAAVVTAVVAGDTYLNLHTPTNPSGELRGQVVEATTTVFTSSLDGSQEVPPVTTTGTGELELLLFEPDNVVAVDLTIAGMTATRAHLHRGVVGVNGPIALNLGNGTTSWCVSSAMDPSDIALLKSGGLYTNVHSSAVPGGEIRGQVTAQRVFNLGLNGIENGTGSSAFGRAKLVLNSDNSITYTVDVSGFAATVAHIHRGAAGQTGGIVTNMTGGGSSFSGTGAPLSAADLALLDADGLYINVHSAAFPAGEIRGQILNDGGDIPAVYGRGCAGVAGTPTISSPAPALAGFNATIDLTGGTTNSVAAMLLGFSRDTGLGSTLPLELSGVGLPGCFLLHDNTGLAPTVLTDGSGCSTTVLPIPGAGSLLGLEAYGQWAVLSAGTNPLGVVLSNAVALKIR